LRVAFIVTVFLIYGPFSKAFCMKQTLNVVEHLLLNTEKYNFYIKHPAVLC